MKEKLNLKLQKQQKKLKVPLWGGKISSSFFRFRHFCQACERSFLPYSVLQSLIVNAMSLVDAREKHRNLL